MLCLFLSRRRCIGSFLSQRFQEYHSGTRHCAHYDLCKPVHLLYDYLFTRRYQIKNCLEQYSSGRSKPSLIMFSGDKYSPFFNHLLRLLDELKKNHYHNEKWQANRRKWARDGMYVFSDSYFLVFLCCCGRALLDKDDMDLDNDVELILDWWMLAGVGIFGGWKHVWSVFKVDPGFRLRSATVVSDCAVQQSYIYRYIYIYI